MHATAKNVVGASLGDRVLLAMDETQILRAATVVYLIPLGSLVIGFILGYSLATAAGASASSIGAVTGIAALVAALFWVARYDKRADEDGSYSFRVELESEVRGG